MNIRPSFIAKEWQNKKKSILSLPPCLCRTKVTVGKNFGLSVENHLIGRNCQSKKMNDSSRDKLGLSGVNVIITIFCYVHQFSAGKNVIFLKTNVKKTFFQR
jgi:hypothetical protein